MMLDSLASGCERKYSVPYDGSATTLTSRISLGGRSRTKFELMDVSLIRPAKISKAHSASIPYLLSSNGCKRSCAHLSRYGANLNDVAFLRLSNKYMTNCFWTDSMSCR